MTGDLSFLSRKFIFSFDVNFSWTLAGLLKTQNCSPSSFENFSVRSMEIRFMRKFLAPFSSSA